MVSNSGTIGTRATAASWKIASLVAGINRMPLTTSKLLPRSASDWMSPVPSSASSGSLPRNHFASNART